MDGDLKSLLEADLGADKVHSSESTLSCSQTRELSLLFTRCTVLSLSLYSSALSHSHSHSHCRARAFTETCCDCCVCADRGGVCLPAACDISP